MSTRPVAARPSRKNLTEHRPRLLERDSVLGTVHRGFPRVPFEHDSVYTKTGLEARVHAPGPHIAWRRHARRRGAGGDRGQVGSGAAQRTWPPARRPPDPRSCRVSPRLSLTLRDRAQPAATCRDVAYAPTRGQVGGNAGDADDRRPVISYVGAGVSAAGACTPLNLQSSSPGPREESRDRAVGQRNGALRATDQELLCTGSITRVLHAPGTARFTLTPSGPYALAGHVDVQNRSGAYVRREVWCEFGASGTLQHALVEQDPAVLRETIASK